ncbi:tripartite tricarboxylate transporter substrate-binding protein [Vibrio zhugei]|nr:tripartite tricarboxylate transporter substrate-binding protein [Vibrio zhugei]
MVVLLVSLARRAYHFQQLASSSTYFHECRTYYLKSGALMELVSGGIDFTTSSPGEAKSMVDAGMVKNLATMAKTNTGLYKDIPVFQQATQYKYTFSTWNALVAPTGISPDIQNKLIKAMKAVFAECKLQQFATKQGFEVYPLYGDKLAAFMKNEDEKYGKLINKLKK